MIRLVRSLAVFLLASGFVVAVGCDGKKDGEPNPDLKVPDVKPAGHGSKGVAKQK